MLPRGMGSSPGIRGQLGSAVLPGGRDEAGKQTLEQAIQRRGSGHVLIERQGRGPAELACRGAKERDRVCFGSALHDDGVQVTKIAHQVGVLAEDFVEFLDPAVNLGGLLEFEGLGSPRPFHLEGTEEGLALSVQGLSYPPNLRLVFGVGTARVTGRQTHVKLGIYATRVGRMRVQIFNAPPDLEEVEEFRGETLRGDRGRKGPVVERTIVGKPPGGVAAWEAVVQVQFEQGGPLQPEAIAVLVWVISAIEQVEEPLGFEPGAYGLVFHSTHDIAQVEHA